MSVAFQQKALAIGVPIAVELAALLRSVVLARAIGPDELGRAMLLALVLRLVEMFSDLGVERLLIQAPEGPTPMLQASLHGALVLRGIALGALLLLLAHFLSLTMPDGPVFATYAALALIPILRGFLHLDYRRAEKNFNYSALAKVEGSAALVMLGALAIGMVFGPSDHRILLLVLIAQAMTQVILSHALSERRWQLNFDTQELARIFRFGAPLALNSVLMYLTLQADRLIVAFGWDWSDLAIYGIIAQLALIPAQVIGRAANSLLLPAFARTIPESGADQALRRSLRGVALLGGGFALSFAMIAPSLITTIYGFDAAQTNLIALALGISASVRIARTPLSIHAVATGRTGDTARANLWRAAALAPGLLCATLGTPLYVFALTAIVGEVGAFMAGWRFSRTSIVRSAFP